MNKKIKYLLASSVVLGGIATCAIAGKNNNAQNSYASTNPFQVVKGFADVAQAQ